MTFLVDGGFVVIFSLNCKRPKLTPLRYSIESVSLQSGKEALSLLEGEELSPAALLSEAVIR